MRHEWEILLGLALPHVVRAQALELDELGLSLVLQDAGSKNLAERIATRPISLPEFLRWALQLADAVRRLHDLHLIHQDIHPSNVVLDDSESIATQVDFETATTLTGIATDPASLTEVCARSGPERRGAHRNGRAANRPARGARR
jgi:serine/threonine protein kinase